MSTPTPQATETTAFQDMDVTAQKGWNGFTKFLLGNVIVTIVTLLFIGALTVWR